MRERRISPRGGLLLAALLAALAGIILSKAWVCDDAYITVRTVRHFLHGHGLRWNLDERAQTYSHPLWILLLGGAAGRLAAYLQRSCSR